MNKINPLELLSRIDRIIETNTENGYGLKDILIREGEKISGKTPNGMSLLTGQRMGGDRRNSDFVITEERRERNRRVNEQILDVEGRDLFAPWDKDEMMSLFSMIDKEWVEDIKTKSIDRPYSSDIGRLRFNLYTYNGEFSANKEIGTTGKLGACIRVLPRKLILLEELQLPASAIETMTSGSGLILVTGGTGNGKSTTCTAFIEYLNNNRSGHIITIENPIEILLLEKKCYISQREVPSNVESMAQGVQDAMREFPDALLIGEIRNTDAAEAARFAGESGHIVIGSMHGNTAIGCISKFIGMLQGSESTRSDSLSQCLLSVVAQILVPSRQSDNWVAIYETISLVNKEIKDLVAKREWNTLQELMREGNNSALVSMNHSFVKAIRDGRISEEVAKNYSPDKSHLYHLLKQKG